MTLGAAAAASGDGKLGVADLRHRGRLRARRVEAAVALLIVGIQGTFFHPPQWNQSARLAATVAFVEPNTPYTRSFRIDGLKDGDRLPTEDWAASRGVFYSNKAPGVSLLGIVPYYGLYYLERAAKLRPRIPQNTLINVYLLNLWISVFWNVVAALMMIRRLPRFGVHSEQGALLVALVYSFATLVLPFGCSEWGHSTAAAFITLGILYLLEATPASAMLAGMWFGAATLTEYLAGISLVLAGVFFVLQGTERSKQWWRFALGAAPPIVILLIYQKVCFGSYFTTAASLSNPVFMQPGKAAGLFGAPNLAIVYRMLFENERGVFYQTPILLLSAVGVLSWYRSSRRGFAALAIANIVVYLLAISAMDGWYGGATTSMRYTIIALPFFCALLPDLRAFPYRKTFLLLFTISAVEMLALAATSTMGVSNRPLSDFAYSTLRNGALAFNPLLASIGVRGLGPGGAIAVTYAAALGYLLGVALSDRSEVRAAVSRSVDPGGHARIVS